MKVLLIGSAPSSVEWLNNNTIPEDMIVCAINNAWSLVKDKMHRWYAAGDFFGCGHVLPKGSELSKLFWNNGHMKLGSVVGSFLRYPYWYHNMMGGTMILNCIYDLINRAFAEKVNLEIYIIGSDLVYDTNKTHFYGKGTDDPLRYGDEWLISELEILKNKIETSIQNVKIYNLSTQKTKLPFDKVKI